jgi:RimJ/RimL family protein N-acetyltransferase
VTVDEAFFFGLSPKRGRVELGYWIAPEHRGRGYATGTTELPGEYAFTERRLNTVVARVLASDDGSRFDGEYHDADRYDLLAAEWDAD